MRIWCGIDWSERHHDVALVDEQGALVARRRIAESAAGFRQLLELLAEHADRSEQPIPVAIETAKGLLPAALRAAGYQLFPINPLAVSRYRDRYVVSRAKSDPGDALVLANILRTDPAAHRPLPADTELAASIRVLARAQQDAVWERQQAGNKLRSLLREYYPSFLAAFDDLASPDARPTLAVAATPAAAARLRRATPAGSTDPRRAPPQPRPPGRADPGRATGRAVPPVRADRAGHGPGRARASARAQCRGGQHRRAGAMAACWHPTACTGAPTT
jgi:transposase